MTLPWPPTVNHYWVQRGSKRFLSKGAMLFRAQVADEARKLQRECIYDDITLTIHAYPPDKRRRDLDNICKSIQDALQHARVFEDDYQIDELHVIRKKVEKPGRVEIEINRVAVRVKDVKI